MSGTEQGNAEQGNAEQGNAEQGNAGKPWSVDTAELLRRGEEHRRSTKRRNRLRWSVVVLAAALTIAGQNMKPYIHDAYAGRACEGVSLDGLVPDGDHLERGTSRQVSGIGWYQCKIELKEGEGVLSADAFTRRDGRDPYLSRTFSQLDAPGFAWVIPLPDRLPGYVTGFGTIQLVVDCPGLGKDADGRPRSMLTTIRVGRDTRETYPKAPYRLATAFTDTASERLGCGAKRLPDPDKIMPEGVPDSHHEYYELTAAEHTACSWAADVVKDLPDGEQWRVDVRANGASPFERCNISGPEPAAQTDEEAIRPWADLAAWYGDWSAGLPYDEHDHDVSLMAAHAECSGHAAGFALLTDKDQERTFSRSLQKRLLQAFVEDQAERRHCSDVRYTS